MQGYKGLFAMVMATAILSFAACGGGDNNNNNNTGTLTDEEAASAVTAAFSTYSTALSQAFGGGGATLLSDDEALVDTIKDVISVNPSGSCSDGPIPNPSGSAFNNTITGGGGGSCTLLIDGTSNTFDAVLDCTDYVPNSGDTVSLDGKEGFSVTSAGTGDATIAWGSDNLQMTINGTLCDVNIDFAATIAGEAITFNGCIAACGQGYTISGTSP